MTNSELTRRELMAVVAVTSGALVGEQFMPGAIPPAMAQGASAAYPPPLDLALRVNGTEHHLALDPRTTLLDALREHLRFTGTTKGCDHGQCGACTVIVNGRRINSCLTLAVMHEADSINTIEGGARLRTCIRCRPPS